MTISEKLCAVIEKVNELIDIINGFEVDIEGLVSQDDINNKYKISENADFTGTWFGETKIDMDKRIQFGDFLGTWEGESKSDLNDRIANGDFKGTWEGTTYTELIDKIENGDFTGTWFGETKAEMDDKIQNGDFLGTWDGQTNGELNTKVDTSLGLYQDVVDLINSISGFVLTIIDGGFIANPTPPTYQDLGSVADPITDSIDCGLVIYPCECTP